MVSEEAIPKAHGGVPITKPFLFVAGIPGTGKSTFGEWLETQKGFIHIDLETTDLDLLGLRSEWEDFWPGRDRNGFPAALARLSSPVVLDWGFPPSLLGVVLTLRDAGAQLWWFDGDRISARSLCVNAKGPSAAAGFDCQHARIAAEWASIAVLFGNHIIRTVGPNGETTSPDEIWKMISVWSQMGLP